MKDAEERALLRGIAEALGDGCRMVAREVGTDVGFALFLSVPNGIRYLSSGDRKGMIEILEDWLARTEDVIALRCSTSGGGPAVAEESPAARDRRLAVSRHNAIAGAELRDPDGCVAWFVSGPEARTMVATWVRARKGGPS